MLERIIQGRTDLVFDFLAAGNSPSQTDAHGTAIIRWCAYYGDVSAVRYLIQKGASLDALGDNYDLCGAAFHGHWQLCQFLLEQGADPNRALSDTGETPLHSALCTAHRVRHDRVVDVLLRAGADPNRRTIPDVPTGGFMRDCRTRGESALHRAAAFGGLRTIDLLLSAGADLTARDHYGDSPLSWASWHLRPDALLRKLCFGEHQIRADRDPDGMAGNLAGNP